MIISRINYKSLAFLLFSFFLFENSTFAQTVPSPSACYIFDNNFENSSSGTFNDLVFDGTTNSNSFVSSSFPCNEDDPFFLIPRANSLVFSGSSFDTYTLQLYFKFTNNSSNTTTGRKRILMYGSDDDKGFYLTSNNQLQLQTGTLTEVLTGSTIIAADGEGTSFFTLSITRNDTDNLLIAYVNGQQQFTFTDALNDFTITTLLSLFIDDLTSSNLNENSGSFIDFFRVYDQVLSSSDIATLHTQLTTFTTDVDIQSDLEIVSDTIRICEGDSVTLSAIGGSGSYIWSIDDQTPMTSIKVGPTADSVFRVQSVVESTCGGVCFNNIDSVTILVTPIPITTVSIGPACEMDTTVITYTGNTLLQGGEDIQHYWVWGDGDETLVANSDSTQYHVVWSEAGIKNIGLSITNRGCKKDTIITFEVFERPEPSISISSQICQYQDYMLTYNDTVFSALNFDWSYGEGATATLIDPDLQNYNINWDQPGDKLIKVIVTNTLTGCKDSTEVNLTVDTSPLASFTASNNVVCIGDEINLLYDGTSDVNTTFDWQLGELNDGVITTTNTPDLDFNVMWNSAGIKKVLLTATDQTTGCSTQDSTFIYVNNLADFSVSSNQICSDESLTLSFTGAAEPGATITCTFDGGTLTTVGTDSLVSWPQSGTYDITITVDGSCGTDTRTETITVFDTPVADFSISDDPICVSSGSTTISFTGTANNNALYFWDFGGGVASKDPNSEVYSVTWNDSGVKTITLTVNQDGCSSTTISKTVSVNNDAQFSMPTQACINEVVRISFTGQQESAATFNWDFGVDATSVEITPNVAYDVFWSTTGTKNVRLEVQGSTCANSTLLQQINVGEPTALDFTVINPIECLNDTVIVRYDGIQEAGKTLTWDFGDTQFLEPIENEYEQYQVLWQTPGDKEINVSINNNGCVVSDVLQVTVLPIPTATIESEVLVCLDDPIEVEGIASVTNDNFTWIFTDANDVVNLSDLDTTEIDVRNFEIRWRTDGEKKIKLIVQDDNGCFSDTVTQMVRVVDTNIFNIESSDEDNVICEGDPITFTFDGTNEVGNIAWEFGQFGSPSQVEDTIHNAFSVTWNEVNPGFIIDDVPQMEDVKVFIHEVSCITEPFVLPIEIRERPDPNFVLPSTACVGTSVFLDYTGVETNPNWVYTWEYGSGANAPAGLEGSDHNIVWNSEGLKTVMLTIGYADGRGCEETFSQTIEIQGQPQFNVPAAPNYCVGDSIELVFDGLVENYDLVEWNITDGTSTLNFTDEDTVNFAWPTEAPSLNITLTTTGGSCSGINSSSQTISIIDNNNTLTLSQLNTCLNNIENIDFSNNVPSGVTSFTWELAGGDTTAITDGNPYEINISFDQAGTYEIFLYVEDNEFCNVNTITQTIVVDDVTPSVSITNVQDEYCFETDVTLQAVPFNGGTATYSWFVNNVLSGTGDVLSGNNYNFQNGDKVFVRMTSSETCANPATVASETVTINIPGFQWEGTISADPTDICPNFGETTIEVSGDFNLIRWEEFDPQTNTWTIIRGETANTLEIKELQVSTRYRAYGSDRNGCEGVSQEIQINILTITPLVASAEPLRIRAGFGLQLNALNGNGNHEWYIDDINTTVKAVGRRPIYITIEDDIGDRQFIVKSTTNEGCEDTASVDVVITPIIAVPNTFTPNNDGFHDLWEIEHLGQNNEYPNAIVWVYNRWGKLVFQSVPGYYSKRWDGTFNGNGSELPAGTYYYVIDLMDGFPQEKGSVTIVY